MSDENADTRPYVPPEERPAQGGVPGQEVPSPDAAPNPYLPSPPQGAGWGGESPQPQGWRYEAPPAGSPGQELPHPPAGDWNQPPQGGWIQPPPGGWGQPPAGGWGPPPVGGWGPPPPAPPGGSPSRRGLVALAAAVAGLLLLGGGMGLGWTLSRGILSGSPIAAQPPIRLAPQSGASSGHSGQGVDAQSVANKVDPATVDINTVIASIGGRGAQAAGTGMILTSSGQVLTNNHVIEQASSIKVTVQGHSTPYTATVIGTDPTDDVALLQLQGASGLPTVTLANSSGLTVGENVAAIGNALGQGGTPSVTQGSITALNQSITARDDNGNAEQLSDMIQTDAPIQSGDSGGPLVNSTGQVVGMITAGQTQGFSQSTSSNVGFAIPASDALSIVNQIRGGHAGGNIIIGQPGYLGVGVRALDSSTAAQLGLSTTSGALVVQVAPGSPAAQAGISQYSVITAVDGKAISSASALGPAIQSHKPGQQMSVTWVDQNGSHTATVTLASSPAAP